MPVTAQRRSRAVEARMLEMADRVFNDFDELPVRTVFQAISAARSALRQQQVPASPDAIEALARERLRRAAADVA